jgi:pimeloyl-ACP methyl ester carboxylesterase
MSSEPEFLNGPNGMLAFRRLDGRGPMIVWFGGFKSDMAGTKAEAIADWAAREGRGFLRFDYSGHGASAGRFVDGTISAWLADALAAIKALTAGPLLLVGSSMGGWLAALAALRLKERMAGAVFIAPAPDFTEALIWDAMTGPEREQVMRDGMIVEHSPNSIEPTIITRALIEDGRTHLILGDAIDIVCPVRIVQGMADDEVPWRHATAFAELLRSDDVETILLKTGDHRLSTPPELATVIAAIEDLATR